MKTELIAYGDGYLPVQVPEDARVLRPNPPLPPLPDVRQAVREALYNPIAHEPVHRLVGPKAKVLICFDDTSGATWQVKAPDVRRVAIEVLLEEMTKAGVPLENVTLMCTQGLHRKLTRTEMETFLGRDLVLRFPYTRLYSHDAEDKENIVHVGKPPRAFMGR
jgi:nickel-dependent lactate racemase